METRAITRRIMVNLAIALLMTVATVGSALWWMAHIQDEDARRTTRSQLVSGIETNGVRAENVAVGMAGREGAYDAFRRGDADWLASHLGSEVTAENNAEMAAIVSPAGEIAYAWTSDRAGFTAADALDASGIATLAHAVADLPPGSNAGRHGLIRSGDRLFLIGAARMGPADSVAAAGTPILVAAVRLDSEAVAQLGTRRLVRNLSFHVGPAPSGEDTLVASDLSGRQIGLFAWEPPLPGLDALRTVLPPIGFALVVFGFVAAATAFAGRRLAVALARSEQQALVAARTDSLTGLLNRAAFLELMASRDYADAAEAGDLAVIYIDVNGFKGVNDSLGHQGGDELVRALGERLGSVLPPGSTLARIGGDEFVIALRNSKAKEMVAGAAASLVHTFDQPYTVAGFEFYVTAAIGYASASRPGITPTELVRRADLAMYQAKNAAEREAVAYHPTMETGALEKKQVETALRRAIESDGLSVVYQPIVRAHDLSVVGLEALVRWNSKEFGVIAPALFVPVAEETGLINEVGMFVIEQACKDLAAWPEMKISVNVSPVQLRDPNFANDVIAVLGRYGVSPHQFELELTEGILVSNPAIAKRKLQSLRELGFSLSLDDFGTGFSSIGYLRQFPFDKLKVDRSFVREIGISGTANALMQALVSLGDAMDLDVVAEGIENEEQLSLLRLVQCEYIQGFYIAKPLTAEEVVALFERAGPERRLPAQFRPGTPRLATTQGDRRTA